jgi:YVTN family beta-propeller protein
MRRALIPALFLLLGAAILGGTQSRDPSAHAARPVASIATGGFPETCTAAEKAARVRALAQFRRTMAAQRKRFFRTHRSHAARRRFVRRQLATLRALEGAAACTVLPPGARLDSTFAVPKDGALAFGLGSLWVDDREDGAMPNGVPAGRLYRIDPETGATLDAIPQVLGADALVANGSVWLPAFALNRLLRVDPATNSVLQLTTGPTGDEGPISVAAAQGEIWVANHHSGTLVRVNPATNAVDATIPLTQPGPGGLQPLATDGSSIWVASAVENTLWRVNAATAQVVASTTIQPDSGAAGVCAAIDVDATGGWVAPGCGQSTITRVDPQTNAVAATVRAPGPVDGLAVGLGSVWVTLDSPQALVRIDPSTDQVVGEAPLPSAPAPFPIRVADGALWVRVRDAVLKFVPL